jgi:sulfhydrogenase subunit beta (sulfur reductase)
VLKYEFGDELKIEDFACKAGEKTIIFGARPCDVSSMALMDRVYLEDPVDEAYRRRRENTAVIALGCKAPDETCFVTRLTLTWAKLPEPIYS